ncbi:MAG: 4-hydroxy-tetrahydrodipicolinate reductase [Spirochaetes bacterium]|nr:4-hydroxy-tetrahydrodipicolinate reductase [Spirochaetota bacterium]
MVKIGIIGACGRMGKILINAVTQNSGAVLSAAVEFEGHPDIGNDASVIAGLTASGILITSSVDEAAGASDVLIDFSSKDSFAKNISLIQAVGKPVVIGITGLDDNDYRLIEGFSAKFPVVYARNFSTGITLLTFLVGRAAKVLNKGFDLEIIEAHHHNKKDAPSGTALQLAEAAAEAMGRDLNKCVLYGREGMLGERPRDEIAIHAIRGGDIVGEHSVQFIAEGESVELSHKARSRMTFGNGALRAALWVNSKDPGLYNMQDVLELK